MNERAKPGKPDGPQKRQILGLWISRMVFLLVSWLQWRVAKLQVLYSCSWRCRTVSSFVNLKRSAESVSVAVEVMLATFSNLRSHGNRGQVIGVTG